MFMVVTVAMDSNEILFWQLQAESGTLMAAVRADRDRAIAFFGAIDVLTEREDELYRTLEAQWLDNTSEEEIVSNWKRKMHSVNAEDVFPFAIDDARDLKKRAREQLKRVLG